MAKKVIRWEDREGNTFETEKAAIHSDLSITLRRQCEVIAHEACGGVAYAPALLKAMTKQGWGLVHALSAYLRNAGVQDVTTEALQEDKVANVDVT